jgi:hypothetical protein
MHKNCLGNEFAYLPVDNNFLLPNCFFGSAKQKYRSEEHEQTKKEKKKKNGFVTSQQPDETRFLGKSVEGRP